MTLSLEVVASGAPSERGANRGFTERTSTNLRTNETNLNVWGLSLPYP